MTRVAAIDCGTNSIRLLVADLDDGGTRQGGPSLTDVDRRMEVVRLGQGVDRTGRIDPEALDRTVAATGRYAERCRELGVERVRFVATSATRDAANRGDFVSAVHEILGVEPEVISGAEEAALSFGGAVSALGAGRPAPYLVVDIGGGSTEFVLGDDEPRASVSVDLGCVRLTERLLGAEPPDEERLEAALAEVRARIEEASSAVPLAEARTLVGVAGTVTTVTAHALELPTYDPFAIDGAALSPERVRDSCAALLRASREERAGFGFMHPGRVDVIGAGALIWSEIVSRVESEIRATGADLGEVVTSEHDILDGIALSLA